MNYSLHYNAGSLPLSCLRGWIKSMRRFKVSCELHFEILLTQTSSVDQKKRDLHESIFSWLSPSDVGENHSSATAPRYPGTCLWIFEHPIYKEWAKNRGILWVNGTGKLSVTALVPTLAPSLWRGM